MTAREYLGQAYRLEQRIELEKLNLEELRSLSRSIGSPDFEEHYNPNRSTSASYEKLLIKLSEMEKKASEEMVLLLKLKDEMNNAIDKLDSRDEQLVLKYRYLHSWTWARIGDATCADERTVRRWHDQALAHFRVPERATRIA